MFEDIENFDTNLLPPGTGNVVVGPEDSTIVLIDDLGIVVSHHLNGEYVVIIEEPNMLSLDSLKDTPEMKALHIILQLKP